MSRGAQTAVPPWPRCCLRANRGAPLPGSIKYTLNLVADRGMSAASWTSFRLKSEVLFLETPCDRFELAHDADAHAADGFDRYRWSRVLRPHAQTMAVLERSVVPLPADSAQLLERDLDWTEIQWSPAAIYVRNRCYRPLRLFWVPLHAAPTSTP